MRSDETIRLVFSCPDGVGIVASVSAFIAEHNGWIVESSNYADPQSEYFFMRIEITKNSLPFDAGELAKRFAPIAKRYDMNWHVQDGGQKSRVVLLVSKGAHCLSDLLYRWRSGEMRFDIAAVISNHEDLRSYVEWHDLPYHHIPVDPANKTPAFSRLCQLFEKIQPDVIVLARYMQILPPELCTKYAGNIINIHHSFLPSFVGPRPYHQAVKRGVKLIGATCHYVTKDLDAGPIIEQDVRRISHYNDAEELARMGRDVEKTVLARGLRYHLEDRVLIHENKTIVFN